MGESKNWRKILQWKLLAGLILAPIVWFFGVQFEFPIIFRFMFLFYVVFGITVFILLDVPLPKQVSGPMVGISVVVFFVSISVVVTVIGHLIPQFDKEHEKSRIERKLKRFRKEADAQKSLRERARELAVKADMILARLEKIKTGGNVGDLGIPNDFDSGIEVDFSNLDPNDVIGMGKLVYQDHECYNCHKIGGKGGKKRGPELDNIGNLVTAQQFKDKIWDPKAWMAEGYEKRTKDKMPDNYQDLMSDEELEALTAYMLTLKNPAVKTPKPIFPSSS